MHLQVFSASAFLGYNFVNWTSTAVVHLLSTAIGDGDEGEWIKISKCRPFVRSSDDVFYLFISLSLSHVE